MSFYGLVPEGAGGHLITLEAQVNIGAPTKTDSLDIRLLGLPQVALKQGIPRWQNALKNSGLTYPKFEVTINLAPADLPKEGTTLEAPIVAILGILGETTEEPEKIDNKENISPEELRNIIEEIRLKNQLRRERVKRIYKSDWVIIGELRLSGELKSTRSLLGMISQAPKGSKILVPKEAIHEASLLLFCDNTAQVFCVSHINEVVNFILGETNIDPIKYDLKAIINSFPKDPDQKTYTDFGNISGQDTAKRAIEIAVAGGHSVLLFGPPGEGKTLLAKSIPGIMPNLTTKECFEINQIYSAKGLLKQSQIKTVRPFRQVHTSASIANILGGRGQSGDIEPGEVSLAHHGVLFLDELPQFPRDHVEQLRAPLAEKKIVIGRASGSIEFKCNFALVSAMNPCICGYYGEYKCSVCAKTIWNQNGECEDHPDADTIHKCKCSKALVDSYLRRLSGPFLDRVDLKIRLFSLNPEQRFSSNSAESSKTVKERIKKARERQIERYKGLPYQVNAELEDIKKHFHLLRLPAADLHEFDKIQGEKSLSTRGAVKVLQVARTIADLDGKSEMTIDHILQALGFMGSTFNEHEIQVEFETVDRDGISEITPMFMSHLKERVLAEISRRRLSKNRCAKEIDLSILTFNKVMRGETNISPISISKINTWLNESSGKSFQSRGK